MRRGHARRNVRIVGVLAAVSVAGAGAAMAAGPGYGPRAFQLVPDNSHILTLYGLHLNGNQTFDPGTVLEGSEIDVSVAVVQYTQPFELFGSQGAIVAALPYGTISGSVETPWSRFPTFEASESGVFDAQILAVMGLIGSPSMSPQEYAAYDPGFQLGVLANVYTPVGEYDAARVLNPGSNRWAAQFGAPMSLNIGKSLLAPNLTTLELMPAVTVFGDNSDPFGPAEVTGQRPLLTVEGHVTQTLNRMIWVSLDGFYSYGGETTTDGVLNDDSQSALGVGGTMNLTFGPAFSVKASYGEVVYRNDDGPDGRMFRIMATGAF